MWGVFSFAPAPKRVSGIYFVNASHACSGQDARRRFFLLFFDSARVFNGHLFCRPFLAGWARTQFALLPIVGSRFVFARVFSGHPSCQHFSAAGCRAQVAHSLRGAFAPAPRGPPFCQGFSPLRLEGGDENGATFHRAEKCAGSTSFSLWVGSQRFRQQQVAAPKSYRISHPVVCVFSCARAGTGLFLSTPPAAPRTFCRLWRLFS